MTMYANYLDVYGSALRIAVPVTNENDAKRQRRPYEVEIRLYEYASLATHAAEMFGCAPGIKIVDGD